MWEGSHPAIIDKEMWEAVQLEMERRRNFALQYGIQKLEYATTENPFAGRVICGSCGQVFGRKVWNSTDDRLRRIIGGATANMLRRGRKGATAGTLMIGFYTRLLFGCLMRWWKTGNYL